MITPEQIQALEETHKRVAHVHSSRSVGDGGRQWEWEIVVRVPTRPEYKAWRAKLHGDGASDATEQLLRRVTVEPKDVDALLDLGPGRAEAAIPALRAMCGLDAEHDRK